MTTELHAAIIDTFIAAMPPGAAVPFSLRFRYPAPVTGGTLVVAMGRPWPMASDEPAMIAAVFDGTGLDGPPARVSPEARATILAM